MDILLCTDADAGATFSHELRRAWPQGRWLEDRPGLDRSTVEVAVVANPPPGRLQGLPRLRLIQSLWAGVDRLLADTSLPAGVPIARMVDPVMTEAMVQTALWAAVSLHRGFFDYARAQRERQWRPHAQRRADDVSVTVMGLGEMGRGVAARLAGLGYRVSGWSLREGPPIAGVARCAGEAAWRPLLERSEIVINLLPLTPATRGRFDARAFAAMPAGAGFVNLARGAHVVDADLLRSLDAGHLAHAVLDVFAVEPLPPEHAYWTHPRVTVLPHAAALTDARSAAQVVAANLDALQRGAPLAHLVDRERGY
jgi:glyoxylate/hydroxypyruvate reductase A